jgi:acyl-coenzyme A synthetase/AMP-(fatty) acid ligase
LPVRLTVVDAFPRTSTGKIDRRALLSRIGTGGETEKTS